MDQSGNGQVWALERAVDLLVSSHYPIAMTGAGVSVESGIPPFRGPGGLWTKRNPTPGIMPWSSWNRSVSCAI
jgi:NAD-dependent SIR2 family protein deacetylase